MRIFARIRAKGRLLLLAMALGLWGHPARSDSGTTGTPVPALRDRDPGLVPYLGRPIRHIDIVSAGKWFKDDYSLRRLRTGDRLSEVAVRRAMRELFDSGRCANARAQVVPDGDGVRLTLYVESRRVIARLRILGAVLDEGELLEATGLHVGGEVADSDLDRYITRLRQVHAERGYPEAQVTLDLISTDDPLAVILLFTVHAGQPEYVARRRFYVSPDPSVRGLQPILSKYEVQSGERMDEVAAVAADRQLQASLQSAGWHHAQVSHRVSRHHGRAELDLVVRAGPLLEMAFEGNQLFDASELLQVLELETNEDRAPRSLADRIRQYYVDNGFLDADVRIRIDGEGEPIERLVFVIREGERLKVIAREYPCLTGDRTPTEVGSEIDSFLSESLPGGDLLGPVDPRRVDQRLGPTATTGARPVPFQPNPWSTYVPSVYERAMKHVQDLYRSEGYLAATVGPAQLLRRRCALSSPPGQCVPVGPRRRPPTVCAYDDLHLPLEEPPPNSVFGCVPDTLHGIACEPTAVLHIPIKLGPRTVLWDVAFEGNARQTESHLAEVADLALGDPVSMAEIEAARRRVLDEYAEEGFAYADVSTTVEPSADHRRARVRFSIHEGEQVRVAAILIRGAPTTSESLIRRRIALVRGEPYRRSQVRATEDRLAQLGVFSSVQVTLEDPYVPAREKNVVVDLKEKQPQYFEGRPGFGTGDGFRLALEYGHLNVASEAIQLTLRVQLGYLPDQLILESDVRQKYIQEVNTVGSRLERRLSLGATFPDVGLGPLVVMGVEGFDVHDNARDFGLTKDAGVVTFSYLFSRRLTLQVGGSLERNNVRIFGATQKGALQTYISEHPERANVFRVPEGTSQAVAQRLTVNWDRRDIPLGATRGTLATGSVEHVTARPIGSQSGADDPTNPFSATNSEFLRWTSRIAGYVPLSSKGTALAMSFRWGINQQLRAQSRTYPDRLFFMGGVDSLRGFLQDSLIPEDVAAQLLDPAGNLSVQQVVIRGGNFFVNPQVELRIPLTRTVQTAVFVDAGNLWSRSPTDGKDSQIESRYQPNYWRLRYSAGTGIRISTPVGPLVFDYGFNIERVLDRLFPQRKNQRYWEGLGAFHFSIGLF